MSDQNIQLNTIGQAYNYKKTEKLVSALYLVSNFISDKEPIKWQVREAGLNLLSQGLSVTGFNLILSYLEVCYISGLISEMNYSILKYEFDALLQVINSEEEVKNMGTLFPKEFFQVSEDTPGLGSGHTVSKGHNIMSDRTTRSSGNNKKDKIKKTNGGGLHSPSADRQGVIISLLKKNKELGIKDFTSSIKDCSEKTIQRELVSLVSKGQVIKMGEKRWSRYSLK